MKKTIIIIFITPIAFFTQKNEYYKLLAKQSCEEAKTDYSNKIDSLTGKFIVDFFYKKSK